MDKLRFCTTSFCFTRAASSCTVVVLPVPVSPTNKVASFLETQAATCSSKRDEYLLKANCCCSLEEGSTVSPSLPMRTLKVTLPILTTPQLALMLSLRELIAEWEKKNASASTGLMPHRAASSVIASR